MAGIHCEQGNGKLDYTFPLTFRDLAHRGSTALLIGSHETDINNFLMFTIVSSILRPIDIKNKWVHVEEN